MRGKNDVTSSEALHGLVKLLKDRNVRSASAYALIYAWKELAHQDAIERLVKLLDEDKYGGNAAGA
ncbi:MAG: hypothetical protein QXZ14_08920 [Candidatus Jordarchaeales archaeon]